MNHHESPGSTETGMQRETMRGDDDLVTMREELREAIRAQEELQVQLRAAVKELSETLSRQPAQATDVELQRIDIRMRSIEQRLNATGDQLRSILQSRIWRALVSIGGFFLRFQRFGRSR